MATTPAQYLQTAYENACARLSELDTLPVDQRARMTYTAPDGRSFGWGEYRQQLLAEVKDLQPLIQKAGGSFTIWG